MENFSYILTAIAAYLLGSIPTGYLVGKARGIDIRTVGSGNMGATNVFRVLGKKAGIFVLLVDALKGWVACWLISRLVVEHMLPANSAVSLQVLAIVGGIAAILGHNYTCWLKFKGGKGVATTAGVLAAMFPKTFLIALAIWVVVFFLSKYVSLASICAAASLPVSEWLLHDSRLNFFVALFMGVLAIYKHKANIQRLLNGTENRFGKKKNPTEPAK